MTDGRQLALLEWNVLVYSPWNLVGWSATEGGHASVRGAGHRVASYWQFENKVDIFISFQWKNKVNRSMIGKNYGIALKVRRKKLA